MENWTKLYRYWRSKHIGERPPARESIDPPLEIPSLIANLMLLEKADGDYRYRLAGTAVEAHAGVALTGQRIGVSPIPASLIAQWRAGLDAVWGDCAPKLFVSRFADGVAVRHITLMLPLATAIKETKQILIGCFFDGYLRPGIKAEGLIPEELDTHQITDSQFPSSQRSSGFATRSSASIPVAAADAAPANATM